MAGATDSPAGPVVEGRIGLIAGSGALPVQVAQTLRAGGQEPFVVRLAGDAGAALDAFDGVTLSSSQLGPLVSQFRRADVRTVCMIGGVGKRPGLLQFRPNGPTFKALRNLIGTLRSGDDAVLRAVIELLEGEGFAVVGIQDLVPHLLSATGCATCKAPGKAARASISVGLEAARLLGALDTGQAVVVAGRRVLALEAVEGTDAMLERVAQLRVDGRLAGTSGGVLVKMSKPGQELRADLPTIGHTTVDNAHAARLDGIAIEAGRSLIVDHDLTVARADALGLFIEGLPVQPQPGDRAT